MDQNKYFQFPVWINAVLIMCIVALVTVAFGFVTSSTADSQVSNLVEFNVEKVIEPEFRSVVFEVNNPDWVTLTVYFSHADNYISAQGSIEVSPNEFYMTDFSEVQCTDEVCSVVFEVDLGESFYYTVDMSLVDANGNQYWFETHLNYGPWGIFNR